MLDIADKPLSETHIKKFHSFLKNNTSDSRKSRFQTGDYKLRPNDVVGVETTLPSKVAPEMKNLLNDYHQNRAITLSEIIDFHFRFERIHPFQDGNGRVGRLIVFKECLACQIIPCIIEDSHKFFYYRGLAEYPRVRGYLVDTFLSAQDVYKKLAGYIFPGFAQYTIIFPLPAIPAASNH